MQQALAEVKKQLGRTYRPVIGGAELPVEQVFDTFNPSHVRELVGRVGESGPQQALEAIRAASAA